MPTPAPRVAVVPLQVSFPPATATPAVRRATETAGLITLLVEQGLGDLPGVVPRVGDLPLSPGMDERLPVESIRWTGALGVDLVEGRLQVSFSLCGPLGVCQTELGVAAPEEPWLATADVLRGVANRLQRTPPLHVAADHRAALSADPYAVLLCGRSAATWYGLLPPVSEASRGDKRRDPIIRAVFVDPGMAHAWWVRGRQEAFEDKPGAARESFGRALVARASAAAFAAGEAASFTATDKPEPAWVAWEALDEDDPRWILPRARAALSAGHPDAAVAALAATAEGWQELAPVLSIRVAIAEATNPGPNHDQLLARWQAADPLAVEPVRKRVQLAVAQGRFEDALGHSSELSARGAAEEGDSLGVALASALGRFADAAERASSGGHTALAARLRVRAGDAPAPPPATLVTDRGAALDQVVGGRGLLRVGKPNEALAAARRALVWDAWFPEALALEGEALAALGKPDQARKSLERLSLSDPTRVP